MRRHCEPKSLARLELDLQSIENAGEESVRFGGLREMRKVFHCLDEYGGRLDITGARLTSCIGSTTIAEYTIEKKKTTLIYSVIQKWNESVWLPRVA